MNDRRIARLLLALALGFMLATAWASFTRANTTLDGLTNSLRQANGLAQLQTSQRLTALAQERARQIVSDFSHNFWWLDDSGCTQAWGENIMYLIPAADNPAQYAYEAFRDSPTHYANMVGDYTHQGSAVFIAANGGQYVVQLFGKGCGGSTPPPPPPPTPAPDPPQPTVVPSAPVQPSYLPNTAMESE